MTEADTNTETAPECTDCGTTEDVIVETHEGVTIQMCQDCLDDIVEEIVAEQDRRAQAEADAFEGATTSRETLSPQASHVRRIVEETYRDFLANGSSYGIVDEPKIWERGDYGTTVHGEPYGIVFTLAFTDEEVREAFFYSNADHYEGFPAGVESRLNQGYFEWIYGFAFELVEE